MNPTDFKLSTLNYQFLLLVDKQKGCIVARSVMVGGGNNMNIKNIDRYKTFGFRQSWLEIYLEDPNKFWENNRLGVDMFYAFDKWAKELIELHKNYPDLSEEVELYEIFKSFTSVGCSSMLPLDDEKLAKKAQMLLDNYNASDTH